MYNGGTQCVKVAHRNMECVVLMFGLMMIVGFKLLKILHHLPMSLGDGPGLVPIFDGRLPMAQESMELFRQFRQMGLH